MCYTTFMMAREVRDNVLKMLGPFVVQYAATFVGSDPDRVRPLFPMVGIAQMPDLGLDPPGILGMKLEQAEEATLKNVYRYIRSTGWRGGPAMEAHVITLDKVLGSARDDLFAALTAEKAQAKGGKADELKADWQAAIKALFATLVDWLRAASEKGLFAIHTKDYIATESSLGGNYTISLMELRTPTGRLVQITPAGRDAFGTKGRVDFRSGPRLRSLYRLNNDLWAFSPLAPGSPEYLPLTEESFFEVLRDLIV